VAGRGQGSGAGRRWAVVAAGLAVLVGLPPLIGALPASDATVSATDLRARALASADVAFSGYAQSAGGLALPVGDQLTSVADLLSDRTTMRTWYRGRHDWRVDVVTATGETDVHADAGGRWTWDFEDATATRTGTAPLALPTASDLLPSALGRRLLAEAAPGEVTRTTARRVAGRDALGLRVTPAAPAASVDRVDVWVDARTGVPLRVQVDGGGRTAALDTAYLSFDPGRPDASTTGFTPPPGATVRSDDQAAELLRLVGRRAFRLPLPGTLAGLDRRTVEGAPGQLGVYGRGVTELAVAAVPERVVDALRPQLTAAPGVVTDDLGVRISAGPLGLMLVDGGRGGLLLTGTVTLDALRTAADEVLTYLRSGDR
jgi:outer membrane lipoprotein-sorting protein